MEGTKKYLQDRLYLEVSEEKSKITNLRKNYSEFLGFKFKVVPKGDKWVVESHMCDKAIERTKVKLKEAMDTIKNTEGTANTERAIADYNAQVYGIHNYFQIATMVNRDLGNIAYEIKHKCENHRLKRRIKRQGMHTPKYIEENYGKSKQLRYINGMAIIPVAYCKHKSPMYKKKIVNKYTPQGREAIHKSLSLSSQTIQYLLEHPVPNRSIEYNDNRMSLVSAQKGTCFITKRLLSPNEMHCHHKIPISQGGTDEYKNLVIVSEEVHTLIHAENAELIGDLIKLISPDKKARIKIDTLREKANLSKINWESYIL